MEMNDISKIKTNKEAHAMRAILSDSSSVDIMIMNGAALYIFSNPRIAVQLFNIDRKNEEVKFLDPNKIAKKYKDMKALEIMAQIGKEIKKGGGKLKNAKGIIN